MTQVDRDRLVVRELKRRGDEAVVHRLRGKASNRRIEEWVEQEAMEILSRDVYRGFGPTLASEYLRDSDIRAESLRQFETSKALKSACVAIVRKRESAKRDLIAQWAWYAENADIDTADRFLRAAD